MIKRLASFILAFVVALLPGVAHAGNQTTARVVLPSARGGMTVAPVQLPAISLNAGIKSLPNLQAGQTLTGASALPLQAAAPGLQPTATGASSNGAQLPAISLGAEHTAPIAPIVSPEAQQAQAVAPEATVAQAITGFQAAVAPQKSGSRVSRVASSILGWFNRKPEAPVVNAMAVDDGASPSMPLAASTGPSESSDKKDVPPPPSSNDGDGPKQTSPVWRNAIIFIAGLVVAQVGIEAWSAAWAKWVQTNYGLDAYTTISMVGMVVSLAAGYVGGWAADKFGLKKTYITTTVLFAAGAAATLALFKFGMLTLPFLIGLSAFRSFVGSAGRTAESTIPIAIFKDNKAALGKFNSVSQFILEFAGIGVPFMIGTLLGTFGSIGTMSLLPITALVATMAFVFVKMGEVKKNKSLTGPAAPDARLLKLGMWTYPTIAVLNMLLYAIIAIGYGNFVSPGSSPAEQALAAGIAGKIVSLYSVGGLLAAAILSGIPGQLWGWLKGKFPKLGALQSRFVKPAAEEDDHTAEVKSTSKWLVLSAVGLLGFLPMLWTSPTLAALAMIPFGLANIMSNLQLMTMVQKNAPLEKKGKIMGTLRTVTTLLSTGGLFGFSWLFKHYAASTFPFVVLLGVLAVFGVYYVFMSRKLKATLTQK